MKTTYCKLFKCFQAVRTKLWFPVIFLLSLSHATGQNLINIKIAGGTPGMPSGAAVIGAPGDVWNYFPSLSGRAVGGGVVTNATTIRDSTGATLIGVSMNASLGGGTGVSSFTDGANFSPNPSLIMANYTYESAGTSYWSFVFSGLPANRTYMLYGMGNGNQTGQGTTWWVDVANGHATATASANFAAGNRDATLPGNEGICWVKLAATTTAAGTLTFRVVRLNAAENGTGGSGREYLDAFQLQLLSAPVITGLTNQTVVAGTTAQLNPSTTGTPAPAFQWRSNGTNIIGATNASLSLPNVQYSQNGFLYSLVASNLVGKVTNSMTLTVIVTPSITGLTNQAVPISSTVNISPTVSGVPTPSLRWLLNGNNLSDGPTGTGATISGTGGGTITIANAQAADSGVYSLVASNSAGIITNSMTLTVASGNVAPVIVGPDDQTVVQTSNAVFSASVSGLPLPTLQWRENGADISGETNTSLTISNVQYAQDGFIYSVVASNVAGQATNSALLHVLVPPYISLQPTNLAIAVGNSATFSVVAGGVPAVSWQWRRNGNAIANATNASYTIPSVQGSDTAVFSVVVSNSVGIATSSDATLTALSTMSGTLLPANGATNISIDQQLRIVFSRAPHLGAAGKLIVRKASDNSVAASIDASQFVTFSLFSATISNAAVRAEQGESFYYTPLAVYGNEVWITFSPTQRLAYNQTYYVNMDSGLFLDSGNASFPAVTDTSTWRFSTKVSGPSTPTASTGPTTLTVGLDGAGDFATLQGASDWVPQNNTLKRTIVMQPGVYRDFTVFTQNRNNVVITSATANRQDVQIIYPYAAFSGVNDSGAGTLRLESSDIYVRNLTLDNLVYLNFNGVSFAGPINTVYSSGRRLTFDNVLIKGGQDTLFPSSGVAYFNNCEIWGSTDFIYGSALAVFDQCNIVEIRSTGGPNTAPSTDLASPYGIVFLNCTFPRALVANGYPYDVGTGTTTFMRPWRQDGSTALINCALGSQISTKGWSEWDGRETTCRAREYGTTLIGGGTTTPAQRQAAGAYWLNTIDPDYVANPSLDPTNALLFPPGGTNNRVSVAINPSDYTVAAIFGNAYFNLNGWLPSIIPNITTQPTNQTVSAGAAATFSVTATGVPSPSFQWLKNGTNFVGQINAVLSFLSAQLADSGSYSVIVSNSAGTVVSSNAVLLVNSIVNTSPTNLNVTVSSGTLQFDWPVDHVGWQLQTNAVGLGNASSWFDFPGSTATNHVAVPIDPSLSNVFFRLTYP
jgi:pectin methylesterase-like acyl-CoA thioesterase